jgi:hypothetical protein
LIDINNFESCTVGLYLNKLFLLSNSIEMAIWGVLDIEFLGFQDSTSAHAQSSFFSEVKSFRLIKGDQSVIFTKKPQINAKE